VKTQIIHLEPHDDTISVKDKMDWAQLARVLIIFPPEGQVLESQLDLVQLERYCSSLGSQLALVSQDPEIRAHAQAAGIPVFSSKREAQSSPWRRSWRAFRRQNLQADASAVRDRDLSDRRPERKALYQLPPWARNGVFFAGVTAVLFFAALLLPRAVVTIPPQQAWQELTVPVLADPAYSQIQVSGKLPAKELSVSVAATGEVPSTGTFRAPDQYASGTAVFTNLTDHTINIPEGTILSSRGEQPVRFLTLRESSLPPGAEQQAEVPIRAAEPGAQGNLPAGSVSQITADFGADLTVTNPEPTRGGSDLLVKAPDGRDREILLESLTTELREEAQVSLERILEPGDVLLTDLPMVTKIQEENYQPAEVLPSETLQLSLRIQFSAWVVKRSDLHQLGEAIVRASDVEDQYQPLLDTVEVEHQTEPVMITQNTARWKIKLRWQERATFDEHALVRRILGHSRKRAVQTIEKDLGLDQSPELELRPEWWFRIPLLPFRIQVN
jgi:hypothetical protein